MKAGARRLLCALAVLAGCAQAYAQQPSPVSLDRIEVTSGARIPASLADQLRDALAARIVRSSGPSATLKVTILEQNEQPDGLHLFAIVAVRDDASGRMVSEFDAEATTPATARAAEALQAAAMADSIATLLARH